MSNYTAEKEVISTSHENIIASMKERGIDYELVELEEKQPDGSVIKKKTIMIKSVPPLQRDLARFFASTESPCWFSGCEEARAKFKEAIEAAGGENGCKGCTRGRIIQQFTPLVEKLLTEDMKRNNIEEKRKQTKNEELSVSEQDELTPTRTIEVPGLGSSSAERAANKPSMLRRAATYLKKIFRVGS